MKINIAKGTLVIALALMMSACSQQVRETPVVKTDKSALTNYYKFHKVYIPKDRSEGELTKTANTALRLDCVLNNYLELPAGKHCSK